MGRPVPDLDSEALDPTHMLGAMRAFVREALKTRPMARGVRVEHLERRLLGTMWNLTVHTRTGQ